MMLDNAGFLMFAAVVVNLLASSQRLIMALLFLVISLAAQSLVNIFEYYNFIIIAFSALLFITLIANLPTSDKLITYMMIVSGISIVSQLYGVISWYFYGSLAAYYQMAEIVFIAQLMGLFYGGISRDFIYSISVSLSKLRAIVGRKAHKY